MPLNTKVTIGCSRERGNVFEHHGHRGDHCGYGACEGSELWSTWARWHLYRHSGVTSEQVLILKVSGQGTLQ